MDKFMGDAEGKVLFLFNFRYDPEHYLFFAFNAFSSHLLILRYPSCVVHSCSDSEDIFGF
jgi:hypothetical protein